MACLGHDCSGPTTLGIGGRLTWRVSICLWVRWRWQAAGKGETSTRYFSLGIGRGVSHALVTGIAQHGEGGDWWRLHCMELVSFVGQPHLHM